MRGDRIVAPRTPSERDAEGLYAAIRARANVGGCFIGRRRTRRKEGGVSIVCCVAKKLPLSKLQSVERIPPEVEWRISASRTVMVRTDVVEAGDSGLALGSPVPGPGDSQTGQAVHGAIQGPSTVGVSIFRIGRAPTITTAGHAILSTHGEIILGPDRLTVVQMLNTGTGPISAPFRAKVLKAVWTERADYALLRVPVSLRAANLYRDNWPLAGIYEPVPADIGLPFWALTNRGHIKVGLVGLAWQGIVGVLHVSGAILTTRRWETSSDILQPGDSGCPLIDSSRRIVGLLHGFTWVGPRQLWVFLPARNILARERAFLA